MFYKFFSLRDVYIDLWLSLDDLMWLDLGFSSGCINLPSRINDPTKLYLFHFKDFLYLLSLTIHCSLET